MIADGYEIKQEIEWDRTRSILQMIYNTSDRVKHPIQNRKDLIYLPYIDDRKPEVEIIDHQKLRRQMEEVVKKRLGK